MHILYIIDSLFSGGAERSLADLAPAYTQLGIELDVAYLHERSGVQDELRDAGARLFPLSGQGRVDWAREAVRLIRRTRPDLVHTTLFEADIAGRIGGAVTRTPVVSSLVNVWYGRDQIRAAALPVWKVRAAQAVDATTARRVTRFHAVSHWVADTMARRLAVPRRRVDVIPRGRDPRQLGERTLDRRRRVRASLGIEEDLPVLLAVARQERQKGLDILLRALPLVARELPGVVALVAGREGGHTAELRELSDDAEVGPRVRWLGERSDVPDLLCAADVFVLPSRWEGFPGSVLEAMALSVPVVATDLPCVVEALGSCGLLVPPEDNRALAAALTRAALAPSQEDVAAGRRRFLEHFTVDRAAEQMLSFYRRSLGWGPAGQP